MLGIRGIQRKNAQITERAHEIMEKDDLSWADALYDAEAEYDEAHELKDDDKGRFY